MLAKGEGVKESEARRGALERYRSSVAIRSMHVAPPWMDHGTLRFPSSLGAAWRVAPLWLQTLPSPVFISKPHRTHHLLFPHLARTPCGDSTSHLNRHTRGQKPWCLGCYCVSHDGRPRLPYLDNQICPHRHLIFSPPLPVAQPPWDCGFFRVASLAGWSARRVFFMGWSRPDRLRVASGRSQLHVRIFPYRFSSRWHGWRQSATWAGRHRSQHAIHRRIDRAASRRYRILLLSSALLHSTRATVHPQAPGRTNRCGLSLISESMGVSVMDIKPGWFRNRGQRAPSSWQIPEPSYRTPRRVATCPT